MRDQTVSVLADRGPSTSRPAALDRSVDWKGLGYVISIVSVLLLGAIAWPKPSDPGWHLPVLLLGMATSIVGMACRYKAHLDQQRELKKTKAEARSR